MGYLVDGVITQHFSLTSQLCTYLFLFSLLFLLSCVYLSLNYRMNAASRFVDLVGFRPCAHFACLSAIPPGPPTRFNFTRTDILRTPSVGCLTFYRLLSVFLLVVWLCFRYRGFLSDVVMSIS